MKPRRSAKKLEESLELGVVGFGSVRASRINSMSAPMVSRPPLTDSTPDRSAAADTAEPKAKRGEPKAKRGDSRTADAVEPHWELVIAAATD
jgi:hypothetical protein